MRQRRTVVSGCLLAVVVVFGACTDSEYARNNAEELENESVAAQGQLELEEQRERLADARGAEEPQREDVQQQRQDGMASACALWAALPNTAASASPSGPEGERRQLLAALAALHTASLPEVSADTDASDMQAVDDFFDPIEEYAAFGRGSREAFLLGVGSLNVSCSKFR